MASGFDSRPHRLRLTRRAPEGLMEMMGESAILDGGALSIDTVERVARGGVPVVLGPGARERLNASRAALDRALDAGEVIYGVNTGFGSLARQRVEGDKLREVQRNLVLSHAAGVGDPLPDDVVRAMMLLLVASLARGLSGVRPRMAEQVVELLNRGITPVVPSVGSVGASGDLSPLAHAALVLIGEGEARVGGRTVSGAEALRAAGLAPLMLEAKEGLALINGTHLMAASGAAALGRRRPAVLGGAVRRRPCPSTAVAGPTPFSTNGSTPLAGSPGRPRSPLACAR